MGRCGKFGTEVGKNLSEHGDHANDQKSGDGEGDDQDDYWVSHGRFDFLFQAGGGLEKAGEAIENFREEPARLAGFDHAGIEAAKDSGVFGDGLVKGIALLDEGGDFSDDPAEAGLFFGIGLFVKGGESGDEREAGVDHRGELTGKENEIRLADFSFGRADATSSFLFDGEDHPTSGHQGIDGVVFVEGLLKTGDRLARGVASGVSKGQHGGN